MKKRIAWMLSAGWMLLIFLMSSKTGSESSAQSGRLMALMLAALDGLFGYTPEPETAQILHLLLRKSAHMAEYAVLFLLLRWSLSLSGARRPGLSALAISVAYAAGDEFHQSFVPDRGPGLTDVAIDAAGAGAGWLLYALQRRVRRICA